MADLLIPIRRTGGLPDVVGKLKIPVEANPAGDADAGDLTKLRIGKEIFAIPLGGGGSSAAFSGARLGLTSNLTAQDFTAFSTLSWSHEVFDDSGYFDVAAPTRLTIPADVTRVVLHAGVALDALSLGADLTFDISKNSTSTGIGFTGNSLAVGTVGRATITTGVIEVVEGDYFDVSIQVVGDTSVTLHQDGTFFSCHAATTAGGGGGVSDGVVEGLAFVESSGSITATLTRSGGLPDVMGTFDVFSGDYNDLTSLPNLFTVVGTPTDQQVPVWSQTDSQWQPGDVGGADNFVGARAGISPARTGQDYGTLTTITWDTEEFDVGGFFEPAANSRMTVPSGVHYAVVHGGVTLGGFANTGDLFIDILKNGTSLGIGSTTKNIGISSVARTSVTTGVVEVSEGDYFELAIRVIQDTSVTLQPLGTFFSCHASSTEIGGSSPDTNDYVSSIAFGLVGQDLTLTLARTGGLSAISGSVTLPSGGGTGTDTNDYATAGAFSLSGQDLTLQLTGTAGFPDR